MCAKLNNNLVIHRLAGDLGIRSSATPVQAVLSYCHRTVKQFLADYSDCSTPTLLLQFLANKLGTRLCEIHNDEDLRTLQREYVSRGEHGFAILTQELADSDTYGITLKLQKRQLWEPLYVSIVDCRGTKKQRGYHTKWHELGHLLILTDQTRLAFRRTHDRSQPKSAEESLVDVVAGEFSFYPPMVKPHARGDISFERIEEIRLELCPEASMYSSVLNLTKLWPSPCIWLEAKLARKKSEQDDSQGSFAFQKRNLPVLRAVHTAANPAAKESGIMMIPYFRVPTQSVISRVFANELIRGDAREDLSMWTSSDGKRLPKCAVRVQVKRIGESAHALICPLSDSSD
jgi:hypothetical protein